MLKNVHLKNLALIKEADIDFGSGLNILTGETGAGKSIIIGSVNIALGDKANRSMIRHNCDSALVELVFDGNHPKADEILHELDIDCDENLIISRKITGDSSSSKVNGQSVTLKDLRRITSALVDIHGQNDHQSLLDPSKHLELIDKFGHEFTDHLKLQLKSEYAAYRKLRLEYRNFQMDEEELSRNISFLEYEVREIEAAGLKIGEDDSLEEEYRRLSHADSVRDSLEKASHLLSDDSDSAKDKIARALKEVQSAAQADPGLNSIRDMLMDLDSVMNDTGHELSFWLKEHPFDPVRFQEISERLNEINKLKSKYGNTISAILSYQNEQEEKLTRYSNYSESKAELEKQISESANKLNRISRDLSAARKKAASVLEPLIITNLKDLNFLNVDFEIHFEKTEKITENGADRVEFLISTNPGEQKKPLAKIASGGEMSRIMLALKSSIADHDEIDTLIFDEIDTGISGRTAQKVSEKLGVLSRAHQIICITHLAQIAAMADRHFCIQKSVTDGETFTAIQALDQEKSVEELARIIGGSEITDNTRKSAAELKEQASRLKTLDS